MACAAPGRRTQRLKGDREAEDTGDLQPAPHQIHSQRLSPAPGDLETRPCVTGGEVYRGHEGEQGQGTQVFSAAFLLLQVFCKYGSISK